MASEPLADLLRAGDVLFRQGDPSGDVFFLRSGRLGVRLRTGEGKESEIDVLEPGAEVGEVGLVTGQPRAATSSSRAGSGSWRTTARAARGPWTRWDAGRAWGRRRSSRAIPGRRPSPRSATPTSPGWTPPARPGDGSAGDRTIALVPLDGDVPLAAVGERLASALGSLGPTLHVDAARLDAMRGKPGLSEVPADHPAGVALAAWMGEQEARHRFVLAPSSAGASSAMPCPRRRPSA